MFLFLSNALEQMDLALDQLAINDPNYMRFALMLVDNVVELTLHQYALDKFSSNQMWKLLPPKYPPKLVSEALKQHFGAKVKLAAETGFIKSEIKDTLNILHSFRNEVYHQGMTHEDILSSVSKFYFQNACDLLKTYNPESFSYNPSQKIPYRSQKYLGIKPSHTSLDDFKAACSRLKEISANHTFNLIEDLANKMKAMIDECDHYIQFLKEDHPNNYNTRTSALIDAQLWSIAYTEEATKFAELKKHIFKNDSEFLEWLRENYPWPVKSDPISKWQQRLSEFKKENDPHRALLLYKNFADQTEQFRNTIREAGIGLDGYIQSEIDRIRNK